MTKGSWNRRTFGGRGKEDWYVIHEDIDQKGVTFAKANRIANFLRISETPSY